MSSAFPYKIPTGKVEEWWNADDSAEIFKSPDQNSNSEKQMTSAMVSFT